MNFFAYVKVKRKYYQKHKERLQKKHVKDIKIFLRNKKTNGEKRPEKDIKLLLKKKKKKASVLSGT